VRQRLEAVRSPTAATVPLTPVRRRRLHERSLIAGLVLVLLAVGGVLVATLPGGGARNTAPPPPRTTTAATTTALTTTKAATPPPPPAPQTPEQALAAARTALAAAQAHGQLDPSAAADLQHGLDDVAKALTHPNPNDAAHKVGDLQRRLGDLVNGGRLTSAGLTAIAAPLDRLASLLPSAHGEEHEHG